MMDWIQRWKRYIIILINIFLLVIAVYFTEYKSVQYNFWKIDIQIDSTDKVSQRFIDQQILYDLILQYCGPFGTNLYNLQTKILENKLKNNKFVEKAVVYKQWSGQLSIYLKPKNPIARIMLVQEPDYYIDTYGEKIPISTTYTAHVLLVSGINDQVLHHYCNDVDYYTKLMQLLNFINNDAFWKTQIVHIYLEKNGDIMMYTQVSKQVVVFGHPENFVKKLAMLQQCYSNILPYKGWNVYKHINLKFANQIICE